MQYMVTHVYCLISTFADVKETLMRHVYFSDIELNILLKVRYINFLIPRFAGCNKGYVLEHPDFVARKKPGQRTCLIMP